MSKKKAKEICNNLYQTIINMNGKLPVHNEAMFNDISTRMKKSTLKRMYNNLIKKYGFRRRLL
jgi:hypothetical protein